MNSLKVNMVRFLMNSFEFMCDTPNGVQQFKNTVQQLVQSGQITEEVQKLVYNIYGITNISVFKPNLLGPKLAQIKMLMAQFEMCTTPSLVVRYVAILNDEVNIGIVSKSARDSIFEIFDLKDVVSGNTKKTIEPENKTKESRSNIIEPTKKIIEPKNSIIPCSKSVLQDRNSVLPQYLNEVYYRVENSRYDGCSNSNKYIYIKITEAKENKNSSDLYCLSEDSSDGCSCRRYWKLIPDLWKREKLNSVSSSSCYGTTYGGRQC